MKIHVALQNDSVKTQRWAQLRDSYRDAAQTAKEMPCQGARMDQTAYITGNMNPTKKHVWLQTAPPLVAGTIDD
jgi:hypothetical protein